MKYTMIRRGSTVRQRLLRTRSGQVICPAAQGKGRAVVRHGRIPQRAPFPVRSQHYPETTTQPTSLISGEGV
ncbi:MAG: hypothetical protein H0X24_12610 [Ktedonobacterales bacterium]|nr:hypothetical protein [Ktedonobacterales bacterium]